MRRAAALALAGSAAAVVRRSDVADSKYVVDPSAFPQTAIMNPGGDLAHGTGRRARAYQRAVAANNGTAPRFNAEGACSLISPTHVITAAHMFEDGASKKGFKITLGGKKYTAAKTTFNPDCEFNLKNDGPNRCDVAIVTLSSAVQGVTPLQVYSGSDEAGKHMDIYGWGVTGTADKIKARDCDDGAEDGKFRHGENTVARVSSNNKGGGIIYYTMLENSDAKTLPLEAISASGDSGGPAIIGGKLAGTNSGSDDNNGCKYGATDQYCRLSTHYKWIQSVISSE